MANSPFDDASYNAIFKSYVLPISKTLMRDIFGWATPEEKAELERLEAIGPVHGPYLREIDWRTHRGKVTTYYKGRTKGRGWTLERRTDCDHDY